MNNTTKTIAILELHDSAFKVIYVDTDPILADNPEVDSLELGNWAVEKHATNIAAVVDVVYFDADDEAKKWGKNYEQVSV
jgi:hypothetical protein